MRQHAVVSNDASVGTTIGTFDAIDTRNANSRLTAGATKLHAVAINAVRAAKTTGTAMLARYRLQSEDLNIPAGSADFLLGNSTGGDTATNSQAHFDPCEWLPLDFPAKGGNVVNHYLSQAGIEPADNWAVQVASVFMLPGGNDPPASWWMGSALGRAAGPYRLGLSSNGGSTTDASTSLTARGVPAWAQILTAYRLMVSRDAVAATTEYTSAFVDFASTGTTLGGFAPQEYPVCGLAASLGTATGSGPAGWQPPLPFWFDTDSTVSGQTV